MNNKNRHNYNRDNEYNLIMAIIAENDETAVEYVSKDGATLNVQNSFSTSYLTPTTDNEILILPPANPGTRKIIKLLKSFTVFIEYNDGIESGARVQFMAIKKHYMMMTEETFTSIDLTYQNSTTGWTQTDGTPIPEHHCDTNCPFY